MRRPGITTQLFLAVLATAVLVTLLMGGAAQFSFSRGFLGYLNEQALEQMEQALPPLQAAYAKNDGSWEFLRNRPGAWFRLIEPGRGPDGSGSPWDADPEQLAPHLLGLGRRMTLLDEQRQLVIGFPRILADSVQREIVVDGRTAGWVVLAPVQSVTDAAALRFQDDQKRITMGVGVLALGLAVLVAWWVARVLLAPVRNVAQATHKLAAGNYGTRVEVRGQDEVAQLAQDFNHLALTLGRNEQMRRDYMADISHELRTPLAVLRGEIEAMQDGIHPLDAHGLQTLRGEVDTLTKLVSDLHELALADVGALRYRKIRVDLGPLVLREAAQFDARCRERDLTLTTAVTDAPVPVHADPDRLRQLLHNLLDNAVRYTDAPGRIQVRVGVTREEGVIDVEDSAPGAPPELLPRLFERFFRAEGSRDRSTGGSGLGLAICSQIVEAHGGHIEARASDLGGVWVRIRLPLRRGKGDAA